VDERKRVSEAKLFGNLLQMDKKKRRAKERKNVNFWCLGYVLPYRLSFFHNLHKFRNTNKTFLQEFSFIAWLT
jgi:hypothetical protein